MEEVKRGQQEEEEVERGWWCVGGGIMFVWGRAFLRVCVSVREEERQRG